MWPGFGDNSRVLAWIFDRCDGKGAAKDTVIGAMPTTDAIDLTGLEGEVSRADLEELLKVDVEGWKNELSMIKEHYKKFEGHLPVALSKQLEELEARLG